jgi:hypothetical protein
MVLLILPGVILCILSAGFAPDSFWLTWFSLAALFAGMVALIALMRRTPCPKCNFPLGYLASRVASGWAKRGACCPHCRVSLDDPMIVPPTHVK